MEDSVFYRAVVHAVLDDDFNYNIEQLRDQLTTFSRNHTGRNAR